jgi:hypothetical protein
VGVLAAGVSLLTGIKLNGWGEIWVIFSTKLAISVTGISLKCTTELSQTIEIVAGFGRIRDGEREYLDKPIRGNCSKQAPYTVRQTFPPSFREGVLCHNNGRVKDVVTITEFEVYGEIGDNP